MVNKGIKKVTGDWNGPNPLTLGYIMQAFMDYLAKKIQY